LVSISPTSSDSYELLGLSATELESFAVNLGQPKYRGRQIYNWLYTKGVENIDDITVLPKEWRAEIKKRGVTIGRLKEVKKLISFDKTTKLLLETSDSENIETVGIPTENRLTVCVSSQIGCSMGCHFCATGKEGLQRSLTTSEIVDQVISIRSAMNRRPSHIVFMGMGEPLLNCESVLSAIRCFNNDLGVGQRRITISTVGVASTLPKLAELAINRLGRAQFTLAVSLHAPNQELREKLIPTAKTYPIQNLLQDCRHYISITGRRVSFEYILLSGLNDQPEHAEQLADLVKGFQSHINLIAYNPIEGEQFKRPTSYRVNTFKNILEQRGVAVSLRASRGLDQSAACGQLRRQNY